MTYLVLLIFCAMALVYSCCFWFSLRLGGIIIGAFSMIQAVLWLIASCLGYTHIQKLKDAIGNWIENMELLYMKDYLNDAANSPEKYVTISIACACVYILFTVAFIYGAFKCSIIMVLGYILVELVRLILISMATVTSLLIIKQNTMDIGLLIAASVGSGFILLAMFYFWVCAANLPILINELEKDEQAETIEKLRRLVETQNNKVNYRGATDYATDYDTYLYTISHNKPLKRNFYE